MIGVVSGETDARHCVDGVMNIASAENFYIGAATVRTQIIYFRYPVGRC